jgi:uncharacterized OsmC-like protein
MENTADKSKELTASVTLINNKLQFKGLVDGNEAILIDYVPPLGDNLGYTSLELLLLSLSSCIGSAILVVLRKMQKQITSFEIFSKGERNQQHPTGFNRIYLNVKIQSDNLSNDDVNKVLNLIDGICPVKSMLNEKVEITTNFDIS